MKVHPRRTRQSRDERPDGEEGPQFGRWARASLPPQKFLDLGVDDLAGGGGAGAAGFDGTRVEHRGSGGGGWTADLLLGIISSRRGRRSFAGRRGGGLPSPVGERVVGGHIVSL